MTTVLTAAIVWPLLVLVLGLLVGRLLRSADRQEEQRRALSPAAAPPGPRSQRRQRMGGDGRRAVVPVG
ncbi:hypothetical protein ACI8AC_08315 [Geodermatophilus sp. SYSU D00758]